MVHQLKILGVTQARFFEALDVLIVVVALESGVNQGIEVAILKLDGGQKVQAIQCPSSAVNNCLAVINGAVVVVCKVEYQKRLAN